MSDDKKQLPTESHSAEVDAFLRDLQRAPAVRPGGGRGRLIFALDATAEKVDRLCQLAGELGLKGVPIFLFHEGGDAVAATAFQQMAKLSRGAYLRFDLASADRLKDLLGAVAVYAAGGYRALTAYGEKKGGEVLRLTAQLQD